MKRVRKTGELREPIVISEMMGLEMMQEDKYLAFSFFLSRFRKGFESEPTLHSGINYAVLLLAAGHQFDSSFELRKVGE